MNERADVVAPEGSVGASSRPRAMIHKKVLDVASGNPEASLEQIADEVSGASAAFVERVLEQFGDPGSGRRSDGTTTNEDPVDDAQSDDRRDDERKSGGTTGEEPKATADGGGRETEDDENDRGGVPTTSGRATDETVTDATGGADATTPPRSTDGGGSDDGERSMVALSELTDAQRETLAVIHDQPTASQKEVGAVLGVSRATVSKRVNALPGFDWRDRRSYVEELFGPVDGLSSDAPPRSPTGVDDSPSDSGSTDGATGERTTEADATGSGSTTESASGNPASGSEPAVDDLADRLDALEHRVDATSVADGGEADVETLHKVLRVCLASDELDEDEEVWLLRTLLGGE